MSASKAFGLAFRVPAETVERYKGFGVDLEQRSGQEHHLLPVPAVFVLDEDGIVQFHYVNPDYRVRIPAKLVLEAARIE